jgi:hypothetical protein
MAHLLYHWRGSRYAEDREHDPLDFSLQQNSPAMLEAEPGDSVWAFTRRDGRYVLAAELVVEEVGENNDPEGDDYLILGDPKQSRYFDVDEGPDIEPLIRSLSISARARVLGSSFQGNAAVRVIDESDHVQLRAFATHIPILDESETEQRDAGEEDSEQNGQGYEQDPERRRAAELHAMEIARAYYENQGFTVTDTSQHEPYDLECRRARQIIRVEVKGTTGAGESVLLTSAEVENARQPAEMWRTDLFVVHGIEIEDSKDGPAATGGEVRLIESWSPDLDDLEVTEYRYRLPATASATR